MRKRVMLATKAKVKGDFKEGCSQDETGAKAETIDNLNAKILHKHYFLFYEHF